MRIIRDARSSREADAVGYVREAVVVGHHSFMMIGNRSFLFARDGYDPELAALFREAERAYLQCPDESDEFDTYGYFATAWQLRQRLQVQGFTADRALVDLEDGIERWRNDGRSRDRVESSIGAEDKSPPDAETLIGGLRDAIAANHASSFDDDFRAGWVTEIIDGLWHYVNTRSLLRVLLDVAPNETRVCLDLQELTGCCVDLDPHKPHAESARDLQLAAASTSAPLIVLTEGSSDSRLLEMAMSVTHPHLKGFVKFIDFAGVGGAEGGVSALSRTVNSFVAAGVANRFVAIADNDTEGHAGLAKVRSRRLPANCRVTHYPNLPILSSYPTLGPYSPEPVLADVNGRAASIEMYLGRDVLTVDGHLVPVQWRSYQPSLGRYHGALSDRDKKLVQDAFARKVDAALLNGRTAESDWTGVEAIIEHLLCAFD